MNLDHRHICHHILNCLRPSLYSLFLRASNRSHSCLNGRYMLEQYIQGVQKLSVLQRIQRQQSICHLSLKRLQRQYMNQNFGCIWLHSLFRNCHCHAYILSGCSRMEETRCCIQTNRNQPLLQLRMERWKRNMTANARLNPLLWMKRKLNSQGRL